MRGHLYNSDVLSWSEQQAALLRRLACGEKVNTEIDWPNVIEEVRDVGQSELRAVRSLLARAIEHLLKSKAGPPVRSSIGGARSSPFCLMRAGAGRLPCMGELICFNSTRTPGPRRARRPSKASRRMPCLRAAHLASNTSSSNARGFPTSIFY